MAKLKIFASGEFHFQIRENKHTLPSLALMQLKIWIENIKLQFEDSEKSIVADRLEKTRI